jgi:glycolate oxidase FAD binding subunit
MASLIESLSASLDSEGLAPSELVSSYAIDGVVPEAAVFPGSVQSVSEVLSLASRHGKAVAPWGGGTQVTLGNPPERLDLVVGLRRLNRITLHEPADLVASAEAGLSLRVLQEELARDGQFLPLQAPVPDRATIGGVLAANASGP